jgi:hypothetical protein
MSAARLVESAFCTQKKEYLFLTHLFYKHEFFCCTNIALPSTVCLLFSCFCCLNQQQKQLDIQQVVVYIGLI